MKSSNIAALLLPTLLMVSTSTWAANEIKSDIEKFSYAIGYQIGHSLKKDNIAIDSKAFAAAIDDVLQDRKTQISVEEMQQAVNTIRQQKMQEKQAAIANNSKAGEAFLSSNKNKTGVVTLESGLQYQVIKKGDGKTPAPTDSVQVHYEGKLLNGSVFDSSYQRGTPATLNVNGVIKGWQEALQLMKTGDKWKLYIPSKLAYGEKGAGSKIGPNETLIFDVELIKIN
jgi:FKBP-type peptidyl-prolyl cis-trans isomerase